MEFNFVKTNKSILETLKNIYETRFKKEGKKANYYYRYTFSQEYLRSTVINNKILHF